MDIYLSKDGTHPMGIGVQKLYTFPNGYQASVVQTPYTYGGDRGQWEVAVLNRHGVLDYSTPITDDVLGYLTWGEVQQTLVSIAALPTCPADCETPEQAVAARRAAMERALAGLRELEQDGEA